MTVTQKCYYLEEEIQSETIALPTNCVCIKCEERAIMEFTVLYTPNVMLNPFLTVDFATRLT